MKRSDPRAVLGATNNVHLYEAVFAAHGLFFEITPDGFVTCSLPPPYYGNAVLTRPGGGASLLATLREALDGEDPTPWEGVAIKDSFCEIEDPTLRLLFGASWIWRRPSSEATTWVRVETPDRLADWEAAWRATSPTERRVFQPALLERNDLAFLASPDGRSGCVANRSEGAVGLSNAFGPASFAEIAAAAQTLSPSLPVVGYEGGEALDAARSAGFETVGDLRVLVAE